MKTPMKLALLLLLVPTAFSQEQLAAPPAACGPKDMVFDVKQEVSQHALTKPDPRKALVYIIQERGILCGPGPRWCVTRVGWDGAWAGAVKNNSYFSVSIEPGEHHLCANVQERGGLGELKGFAHLTAEAGQVYYVRIYADRLDDYPAILHIDSIDSDEAKYLIATLPHSLYQPGR